jgi:glutamine amidotransferase
VRASNSIVQESNCHPFVFGKGVNTIMFMHNGGVSHINLIRRNLLSELSQEVYSAIKGSTDSEICAAIAFDYLVKNYGCVCYVGEQLSCALVHTIGVILRNVDALGRTNFSSLNFALGSAKSVAVTRFRNSSIDNPPPSLFYQTGHVGDLEHTLVGEFAKTRVFV